MCCASAMCCCWLRFLPPPHAFTPSVVACCPCCRCCFRRQVPLHSEAVLLLLGTEVLSGRAGGALLLSASLGADIVTIASPSSSTRDETTRGAKGSGRGPRPEPPPTAARRGGGAGCTTHITTTTHTTTGRQQPDLEDNNSHDTFSPSFFLFTCV